MAAKRELRERWKREPGRSIRHKILDFYESKQFCEKQLPVSSQELFAMLAGLPYLEEVASGRDLRGADFAAGIKLDFQDTDFSYGTALGRFTQCDLSGARFDEVTTRASSFHNLLDRASFQKAKLQSCFIVDGNACSCIFDGANLKSTRFDNSDLSNSSFQNANCKGCCFSGANLSGCDFRGAILDNATFQSAKIDSSTDFRGASLINAYTEDAYNNAGVLIGRGVDLRVARHDETTKFGKDQSALELEIIDSACQVAAGLEDSEARKVHQELLKVRPLVANKRVKDWHTTVQANLSTSERELFEHIMDEAYRGLL